LTVESGGGASKSSGGSGSKSSSAHSHTAADDDDSSRGSQPPADATSQKSDSSRDSEPATTSTSNSSSQAAYTTDGVRLKCREMLANALRTPCDSEFDLHSTEWKVKILSRLFYGIFTLWSWVHVYQLKYMIHSVLFLSYDVVNW